MLWFGKKVKCPYCNHPETKVVDSRESESQTRRRRECLHCEKRFTTYERIEQVEMYVIKKDNRRELFDKEKLKRGLVKACEKRPVKIEQIDKVAQTIENKIRASKTTEVKSSVLGEEVSRHLKKLDKVAYIRFASVYREFKDVQEFEKELKILKKE